ncbi:flagellar protein FliT [Psychrobacillus sp. NEAU-3TGS]|uniref:flagellar protein FliT n=1 Tax=Psychrobacillus sp. NEAU-3TGS TaxID=2995412 RepID=UPI002497A0DF|nr:flagellar protein FliT [Psychrobacillus sp. NEAU-3TGS]MDI2589730.1 flagellar protein FliT [Psychrobacillus sp. NEAU-3TGS]
MIRDSLKDWKRVTELLTRILDVRGEDKRDAVIEQVDKLLTERDKLQPTIQAPFSNEEQTFGEELLPLEKTLQAKLKVYLKDIRLDISEQQKKKVSVNAYMDPYNQVYRDGTFYDKKK